MTAALAQRKYHLAAHLSTGTAKTFGLWSIAAFAAAAITSALYRAATGEYEEFAYYVLFSVPLVMTALGWMHLHKRYPSALANGLTRKEFLTAFAMYGAASILAAAALTQLGRVVIDLFGTFRGTEYHQGFYGIAPVESLVRAALYFALGTAVAAARFRLSNRSLATLAAMLMVGAVGYREGGISFVMKLTGPAQVDMTTALTWTDAALVVLFTLASWALLARAPLPPRDA